MTMIEMMFTFFAGMVVGFFIGAYMARDWYDPPGPTTPLPKRPKVRVRKIPKLKSKLIRSKK